MVTRVVLKTNGDWSVIELDDGNHYRLSGMEKAAHKGLVTGALASATIQGQLIDRDSSIVDSESPFIREFHLLDDEKTFRVRAENDGVFTVTADELKTMLTA